MFEKSRVNKGFPFFYITLTSGGIDAVTYERGEECSSSKNWNDVLFKIGNYFPLEKKSYVLVLIGEIKRLLKSNQGKFRSKGHKKNRWYYVIADDFSVERSVETFDRIDEMLFKAGNYFETEKEAQEMAEKIKRLF